MNRTVCDVLEAMRKAHETRNFSYLPGLIEEAQDMGNRMESALYDKSDLNRARKSVNKLKKEKKQLEIDIDKLKEQKTGLSKKEKKALKKQYKSDATLADMCSQGVVNNNPICHACGNNCHGTCTEGSMPK